MIALVVVLASAIERWVRHLVFATPGAFVGLVAVGPTSEVATSGAVGVPFVAHDRSSRWTIVSGHDLTHCGRGRGES